MKRLRKATHIALVWVSVSLLMVDPAAACRLLAGRRCCCCPCEALSCGTSAGFAPSVPSVSDGPPVATAEPESAAPQVANPAFVQPPASAPVIAAPVVPAPIVTTPAIRAPIVTTPRLPEHSASHEPAAPAPATSNPNRRPVAVPTPVDESVDPLPAHAAGRTTAEPTRDLPAPMPATLRPRQALEPAASNAPPAHQASPSSPMANADNSPASPMPPKRVIDPPMPAVVAPLAAPASAKSPAQPASTRPEGPVVPPTFPPVDDDPFAPLPPATAKPRATTPDADDPFAPIAPPPPARQPKAAPPIADEPAIKLNDPLLPGVDGRLPSRQWSDNSGQFRVEARLVSILDGKVRLLKETGRTTTVPTERLSAADQQYVSEIIARYGRDLTMLDLFAAR